MRSLSIDNAENRANILPSQQHCSGSRSRVWDSLGVDGDDALQPPHSIITLTTDFGLKDGNVGVMKGVIWGICPGAQIADISHLIGPQDVAEAALILARSAPYFPRNSVHVVVVDPGVGTARRPMAAKLGRWYYVGPDNGIVTLLLERAEAESWPREFVELDEHDYWLPEVSRVFHGRDIFAPSAAHLASGVPLSKLGSPLTDPIRLDLPKARHAADTWLGQVIHIDHFGNAATNIRKENLDSALENMDGIRVRVGEIVIEGLVETFGQRRVGAVIALLGSTGNLIISIVNGDAAGALGIHVGDAVQVSVADSLSEAAQRAPGA
jgi:S-adenosylmethionine hydrolase